MESSKEEGLAQSRSTRKMLMVAGMVVMFVGKQAYELLGGMLECSSCQKPKFMPDTVEIILRYWPGKPSKPGQTGLSAEEVQVMARDVLEDVEQSSFFSVRYSSHG